MAQAINLSSKMCEFYEFPKVLIGEITNDTYNTPSQLDGQATTN
jgi:hypothetical protein